ncbi:hypothetical protein [Kitasatospora sp. NPDC001132]
MSLKEIAGRAAVLQALYEEIGAQLKAAKADQAAGLKAAREETGATRIEASLPNGTVVAKVALVSPGAAAVVVDEVAFLEWVRDNRPDQIKREFVTSVREAFVKALLKELTAAGVPQWVDQETGVVHEVPGVRMQPRASYTRMTWEKSGPDAVAEAWRAGELAALVLPELTAGGAE